MTRGRVDVVALVFGVLFLGVAGVALWAGLGRVDWQLLQIVAPLGLVAVGVVGLTLSRRGT